jgi:hypothetical protein
MKRDERGMRNGEKMRRGERDVVCGRGDIATTTTTTTTTGGDAMQKDAVSTS